MLTNIRKSFSFILCSFLILSFICPAQATESKIPVPEKLAEYLYYLELDTCDFHPLPAKDSLLFTFGCSSIRKGQLYGRNLDLNYCEMPEFVIRLNASEDRFASIGLCADPEITCNVSELTEAELLSLPNVTNDGINENGVVISANIVDPTGVDDMTGTAPGKEKIHSSHITRYLLDHAESAGHAVELMRELDIVGGFSGCGLHWMIADANDTYVAEIIGGELVISKNENHFMTNFYLNYGPAMAEQFVAGIPFQNVPLLSDYAIGVERWCILRDGYDDISSEEEMAKLLEAVRSTAMYDSSNNPCWYSECSGNGLSIHSERNDFEKELNRQISLFEVRDRANPQGDWITWHSTVYDLENGLLYVYSQEDYSVCYRFQILLNQNAGAKN